MNESLFRQVGPYIIVDRLDEPQRRERMRAVGLRQGPSLHFMLRSYFPEMQQELSTLRAEVQASAAFARELEHPNLCQGVECGEIEDGAYAVSTFIAGKTLERVLDELRTRGMRLPAPVALYIAHQVCAGLTFVHSQADREGRPLNLTLGALSPASVLIGYEGEVRIFDAFPMPAPQLRAEVPGLDIAYLSPERARGARPDARSDVYGVGLLLYEILTLRSPFQRAAYAETRAAVLGATLLSPSELNPSVERRVDALVMRALSRDPEARFSAAWDMEEALLELSGGVELRKSRGVLAGVLNTIFGDSREGERMALRGVVESLDRAGRFERSGAPRTPSRPPVTPPSPPEVPPSEPRPPRTSAHGEGARAPAAPSEPQPPRSSAQGEPSRSAPPSAPTRASSESPRESAQGEVRISRVSAQGERVSAQGERVSAQGERVSAQGERPRTSAHGEAPPRPPPRRTGLWMGLAAGLGLLALGTVLYGSLRTDEEAPRSEATVHPGQSVIDRLRAEQPDAADPDGLAAAKGWADILDGSTQAYAKARSALEQAAVVNPLNVSAIAGLAVVYADPRNEDAFRGLDAAALLARAESIDPAAPATRHARGAMLLASKDAAGALDAARGCLSDLPEDPVCTWEHGLALRALHRDREALSALDKAAPSLPKVAGVAAVLGETARSVGEFSRAKVVLQEALRQSPTHPELNLSLARLLRQAGQYTEALDHCDRVLASDPRSIEARLLRGALLLNALNRPTEAADTLDALARDPLLASSPLQNEVLIRAAWAVLAAGQASVALVYAQTARDALPEDPAARIALAMALDATGDPDAAETIIRGTTFEGSDSRAMARLRWHAAAIYVRHERERFAMTLLEEALTAYPAWTDGVLTLAELTWRGGDRARALSLLGELAFGDPGPDRRDLLGLAPPVQVDPAWLNAALAEHRDPRDSAALRAEGLIEATRCLGAESCESARKTLEKALAEDPLDPATALLLARVQLHDARPEAALLTLMKLGQQGVDRPELTFALAQTYSTLGQSTQSDAAYDSALASHANALWYSARAQSLQARGAEARAREEARKALVLDPGDCPSVALLSL